MLKYILPLLLVVGFLVTLGSQQPSKNVVMRVLDVGQGDSIYLRLPTTEDILIDSGPDDRVLSELGKYMPIGDRTIELLIVSHNHADHIGGMKSILDNYTVKQIWLSGAVHTTDQYLSFLKAIQQKQIPTIVISAGNKTTYEQVELLALFPPAIAVGTQPEDQHDSTIVLKLTFNSFCALLTGDLDTTHEARIIQHARDLNVTLDCPVLKVTHHGSKNGTNEDFLKAVTPQISVISVGAKNRYGHPTDELLQRLKAIGSEVYRTDIQGTISITSDGATFWTKSEK